MLLYQSQPGQSARAPATWPPGSSIDRAAKVSTLVMIAHPHCPCTRASLDELSRLMADCQGKVEAHVLFLLPPGQSPDWDKTGLRDLAESIPGVKVWSDHAGLETRRFGVATSGQVFVYQPSGKLAFTGGITGSRGHAGDNAGRDAALRAIESGAALETAGVYGCGMYKKDGSNQCPAEF